MKNRIITLIKFIFFAPPITPIFVLFQHLSAAETPPKQPPPQFQWIRYLPAQNAPVVVATGGGTTTHTLE